MFTLYRVSSQLTFQIICSAFLTLLVTSFDLCEHEFKASYNRAIISYFHIDVPRMPKNLPESIVVIRRSVAIPIS